MASISPETRAKIKGYLEVFIQGLVDSYKKRDIIKARGAIASAPHTNPLSGNCDRAQSETARAGWLCLYNRDFSR